MAVEIKKNQILWYRPVHKSKWKGLTQTWPKGTLYRLWDPNKDIKRQSSIEWYGGIDVHLKELTVALFGIDLDRGVKKILGPIITVRTTIQGYQKLFELYDFFSPIRILMETTGVYSIDPYHRCVAQYPAEGRKNRVICMNAHDLSRLLVKNKKMDRIDAARLAFLASIPELLRESYIPAREEYVLRFMLRQRNRYKKDLTKTKNRISNVWNIIEFHPDSGIISNISIDLYTTLEFSLEPFENAGLFEPYGFFFHKKSLLILERFNIYNNENSSNPYLTDSVLVIANFSLTDFQFHSSLTLPSFLESATITVDQSKINFHLRDDPIGNDPNIKYSIYSFYHNTTDFSKPCQTKQEENQKKYFIYRGDTVFNSTVHIKDFYGFLNTEQIEILPLCGYSGKIHTIPVGFSIFFYDEINHNQIIIRREFGLVVSSVILSGSIIWIVCNRIVKKKNDYEKKNLKKTIFLRKF